MRVDVESRLYRAESWLARARECDYHLDGQFIFRWIALNALYGQRRSEDEAPHDRDDLHAFLGRVVSRDHESRSRFTDILRNLKQDVELLLESEFLYEEYWLGDKASLAKRIERAGKRLRAWPNRELLTPA
jgi:hypothetical protein